jgi:hypothetical protein
MRKTNKLISGLIREEMLIVLSAYIEEILSSRKK